MLKQYPFYNSKFVIKPGRVTSDVIEVITTKTTSLLSGVGKGDEGCNDSLLALRKMQKN